MSKTLPLDHATRLARARLALDGLSVGDALGQTCFDDGNYEALLDDPRATARAPWPWTDDTAMALAIFEVLQDHGRIDQDALAKRFAARWQAEPWRGYGAGAFKLLSQVAVGADWRVASGILFNGGSFGNGSAMRIAPLAGYFAEDSYETVVEQAALSAAVTHAHTEGIAGGIAAAVAGTFAWKNRDRRTDADAKRGLIETVFAHTPEGAVRKGIEKALTVPLTGRSDVAAKKLGNGGRISCQDTVPFCVWCAARYLDDYQSALVNTIMMCGDIDTNAAIVGGIVSLATGADGIPEDWLADREALVI
jgi:ADP-ribosylglycohydrolase